MKIQRRSDSSSSVLSANLMAQSGVSRPLMLESNSADQPGRTVSALLQCLCAFFLVIGIQMSSVAGEVVIFGASHIGPEGDSTLQRIDPLTGAATAVGTGIGFQRVSMDFDPTTGILYATGEREAGDLDVNVLLTINPSTGVGTEIGPTGTDGFQGAGPPPGLITDISFRPSDQTLFAWAYPGEWVATIDLVSGAGTQLAFSPGFLERGITANAGNALAFLGSGILVHAATDFISPGFPGALHEIDFATTPANQMATVLASLNFPISPVFPAEIFARANGMDFDFASGTLFASIVYSFGPTRHNFLGTIDTTTGDVTLIGQTKTGMDALAVISSVDIDIEPGSDPNSINPRKKGVVQVAILGSSDFDATQVDVTTVLFGPDGATPVHDGHVEDVNTDGFFDFVVHFNTPNTGIACDDTDATLIGSTGDSPFIGMDSVKTAGCREPARIAFGSNRDGNFKIFLMDADGSNQTPLTTNTGNEFWPDWSPDGRKIAFYSLIGDGNREIYVVDSDGSNLTKLTNNPFRDETPVWSPDGNKIAFSTRRDGDWEVYVMDADGSNPTNLTMTLGVDVRPTWSPNGRKIAFDSNRDGNFQIFVMDADGSNQTNLTNSSTQEFAAAWSPNGGKIAFNSERDGNREIYVMNVDGLKQTRLTANAGTDRWPDWSPDGRKITFDSDRDGNREIYVMDADGSNQTRLTNNTDSDLDPKWSPGRLSKR